MACASAVYAASYDSDSLPDSLRRISDECGTFCGCDWDAIPSELHPVLATKLDPNAPGRTGPPLGPTEAPNRAESLVSATALCFAKPAVWPGTPLRGVPGHTSCAPLAQVGASRSPEGGTARLRLAVGGRAPEFSGHCLAAILAHKAAIRFTLYNGYETDGRGLALGHAFLLYYSTNYFYYRTGPVLL